MSSQNTTPSMGGPVTAVYELTTWRADSAVTIVTMVNSGKDYHEAVKPVAMLQQVLKTNDGTAEVRLSETEDNKIIITGILPAAVQKKICNEIGAEYQKTYSSLRMTHQDGQPLEKPVAIKTFVNA